MPETFVCRSATGYPPGISSWFLFEGLGMGGQWRIAVPHPTGYPGSASGGGFKDVVQEMHVLLFRFVPSDTR